MKSLKGFLIIVALTLIFITECTTSNSNIKNTSNATNSNQVGANFAATPAVQSSQSATDHGGMNHKDVMQSSPNAAAAPYDLQFLDTMIAHHQGAVEMSRPAATKAQHSELRELTERIITDQEREIAQMNQWREQWYAGKPAAVNMEMPGMLSSMRGMDMTKLNAASGKEYDLLFLDMMTPHHDGAVTMARAALTRAEHPEIKKLAQTIIDQQENEIAKMNKWKDSWR